MICRLQIRLTTRNVRNLPLCIRPDQHVDRTPLGKLIHHVHPVQLPKVDGSSFVAPRKSWTRTFLAVDGFVISYGEQKTWKILKIASRKLLQCILVRVVHDAPAMIHQNGFSDVAQQTSRTKGKRVLRSQKPAAVFHTIALGWYLYVWLWHWLSDQAQVLPGAHGFGKFFR